MIGKRVIALSIVASCVLYSQEFNVHSGWQLLGTQQAISDLSVFDDESINRVWRLDATWQAYPETGGIDPMLEILPNDGFWVNASGDVVVNVPDAKNTQTINISSDFQLLGATVDINVAEFDQEALRSVWTLRDGAWSRYPHQDAYEKLNTITKGEGFWLIGNNETNFTVTDAKAVRTQEMNVKSGWQLKGTQLDTNTMEAFDISAIDSVWTFEDNDYKAYPAGVYSKTLEGLSSGQGFWISANANANIDVNAKASEAQKRVIVSKGWQLLGAREDLNIENIFNVEGINVIYVLRDGEYKTFKYNDASSDLSLIKKGEGYWLNSSSNRTLANLIEINGSVVDGYIKDARLSIASLSTGKSLPIITSRDSLSASTFVATSAQNGGFTFFIESSGQDGGYIINSNAGIDRSTGEAFDGSMQAIVSINASQSKFTSSLTPMTTLISNMARRTISTKGLRGTSTDALIEEAKATLAAKMGLDKDILDKDPIELLKNGSSADKIAAAKLLKNIMVVQKNVEMLSKSVASKNNANGFNEANEAILLAVAGTFTKGGTKSFEEIMKDTSTIIADATTELAKVDGVSNASEKLNALKDVIKNTVNSTLRIKEDEIVASSDSATVLQQIEAVQKSVEIVTRKIEEKVALVADATSSFDTVAKGATDAVKAIAFSGGIEGIKTLVKKQIDAFSVDGKTIDVSTYTDLILSDANIEAQTKSFEALFGESSNSDFIEAATASFEDIVAKQSNGEEIDATTIASIIDANIAGIDGISQTQIDQISVAATAQALTIIDDITALVTESVTAAVTAQVAIEESSSSSTSSSESSSSSESLSESSSSSDPFAAPTIP